MVSRRRLFWIAVVLFTVFGVFPGIYAFGFINGWYVHRQTPQQLASLLQPADRVLKPDGPGPFPAVLQFHGCGGIHAADEAWRRFFVDHGYVAMLVDSLGPRHIPLEDPRVCGGRMLWGRERAGDVLVAIDAARKLPFVDPRKLFLAGWSHGAWSIADLLALDPPKRLPTNLTSSPCDLGGVAGAIFFYPYLGFGALARSAPTRAGVPILMLLSGADQVVPTPAALEVADRLRHQGIDVQTHVYEGLNHCWDQIDLPPDGELRYDPKATEDARRRVLEFLTRAGSPPSRR